MKHNQVLSKLKTAFTARKLYVFSGAGISVGKPASMPLALDIKNNVLRGLRQCVGNFDHIIDFLHP